MESYGRLVTRSNIYVECGNIPPSKGDGPRKSWRMRREKDRDAYKGKCQKESLFKEEPELVKRSNDLSVNAFVMRRTYYAGRSGNWEGQKQEIQKMARSVHGQVSR